MYLSSGCGELHNGLNGFCPQCNQFFEEGKLRLGLIRAGGATIEIRPPGLPFSWSMTEAPLGVGVKSGPMVLNWSAGKLIVNGIDYGDLTNCDTIVVDAEKGVFVDGARRLPSRNR